MGNESYYSLQSSQTGDFPDWARERKPKDQLSPESMAMSLANYATAQAADPFAGLQGILGGDQAGSIGTGGDAGGYPSYDAGGGAGGGGSFLDSLMGATQAVSAGSTLASAGQGLAGLFGAAPALPAATVASLEASEPAIGLSAMEGFGPAAGTGAASTAAAAAAPSLFGPLAAEEAQLLAAFGAPAAEAALAPASIAALEALAPEIGLAAMEGFTAAPAAATAAAGTTAGAGTLAGLAPILGPAIGGLSAMSIPLIGMAFDDDTAPAAIQNTMRWFQEHPDKIPTALSTLNRIDPQTAVLGTSGSMASPGYYAQFGNWIQPELGGPNVSDAIYLTALANLGYQPQVQGTMDRVQQWVNAQQQALDPAVSATRVRMDDGSVGLPDEDALARLLADPVMGFFYARSPYNQQSNDT